MANEERQREPTRDKSPIVLIADDDQFFRMALKSILLTRLNVSEVIETGSFDEALEQLSERTDVFLALIDLQMPGVENAMSLRVVRESFPKLRTAVVSSSQQRHDIIAALNAGVHGYVPKGLGPTELTSALRLILNGTMFVPRSLADLSAEDGDKVSISAAAYPRDVSSLTPRQRQVLELLISGKSNKEIARGLKLGEGTVKIHMAALFRSLGVPNRAAAAVVGARLLSSSLVD